MNIKQLEYFISVAELRSFTKAAQRHFMSQAAITQQMRVLEESVGRPLIKRDCRPIELTPAGYIFLKEAADIVNRMNIALAHTRDTEEGIGGELRIGYAKGLECGELPQLLQSYHQTYPSIRLTCYRRDSEVLVDGLNNGEFDLIYNWNGPEIADYKKLTSRKVMDVTMLVALYQGHPLADHPTLTRADLKESQLVFMTPSGTGVTAGDSRYMSMYQKAGYDPNVLLKTSDIESVLMMVASEVGIAIIPSFCANKLSQADNLVFTPLTGEETNEEILALWKKDDPSPALLLYLDLMNSAHK